MTSQFFNMISSLNFFDVAVFFLSGLVTGEVYNRYFWHNLFICNSQINKKAYPQTLQFFAHTQNISYDHIHTKK